MFWGGVETDDGRALNGQDRVRTGHGKLNNDGRENGRQAGAMTRAHDRQKEDAAPAAAHVVDSPYGQAQSAVPL